MPVSIHLMITVRNRQFHLSIEVDAGFNPFQAEIQDRVLQLFKGKRRIRLPGNPYMWV